MNNHIQKQSSSSATSINLYQLLNKHFFLLCSITYLSLITISTISWERICPQDSYSWQSTSSNSLDNHTLTLEKSKRFSTWFYTFIILGCSSIPWCLAYLFRQKAYLNYQKSLRCYPSPVKMQITQQPEITTPVRSTSNIPNPPKSIPSYRITTSKTSKKKSNSLSKNKKNIKLPFERIN